MLTINGAMGEGGGQILRSALALSLCLQQPFRMINIRAARRRPGMMFQHLAAVNAAAAVGDAEVDGARRGSQTLQFRPHKVSAGDYYFDIGTAGSTTLVLQTVLPALLTAAGPSRLRLHGGTHNPLAPPFDFFQHAFLPLINKMGPTLKARLERPGFYPMGGGVVEIVIEPATTLHPLTAMDRGAVVCRRAWAMLSRLPEHIARRELQLIAHRLELPANALQIQHVDAHGPGNAVSVLIESEQVTELFSGIGERGVRAERVALGVVREAQRYLAANVPVGEHLADQLVLPAALAGGGFVTLRPSRHTTTNIDVVELFTGRRFQCKELAFDRWHIGCL